MHKHRFYIIILCFSILFSSSSFVSAKNNDTLSPVRSVIRITPPQEKSGVLIKLCGGKYSDSFAAVAAAPDGTIWLAGKTTSSDGLLSDNKGLNDGWLLHIDPSKTRQIIYSRNFGGVSNDFFSDLAVGADGTVWAVGETALKDGTPNGWIIGINPSEREEKQVIYNRKIPYQGSASFKSVIIAPDGTLWIAGECSVKNRDIDGILLHVAPNRSHKSQILYSGNFGGSDYDSFSELVSASDGTFWLAGTSYSANGDPISNRGGEDGWLIHIDPSRLKRHQVLYSRTFGGKDWDNFKRIAIAPDGTLWLAGTVFSAEGEGIPQGKKGKGDGWLLHIDPSVPEDRQILYSGIFGGKNNDSFSALFLAPDATLWLAGTTFDGRGSGEGWVIQINPSENRVLYSDTLGSYGADALNDITCSSTGKIWAVGETNSNDGDFSGNKGDFDGLLCQFIFYGYSQDLGK